MTHATGQRPRGDIETARPLRLATGELQLRGWCFIPGRAGPPSVRLRTDAATLSAAGTLPRPDLNSLFPDEPAAPQSGFTIEGRLPPGFHVATIEAKTGDGEWGSFRELTIAVPPADFHAGLDEPIAEGVLRDRVKVGGWALDERAPIAAVTLHYGHRRMPCVLDQSRADVAAAFPDVPHAGRCGFISEDFLVAGHGPVRIHVRLVDGRERIHETRVTFSIATDENHAASLDLAAARIGFPSVSAPAPTRPQAQARPLNVLYVLHGSFAANSAIHVAALANQLAERGSRCVVAVTHDLETLSRHHRPQFRGVLHADVGRTPLFPGNAGPDLIHAWTTRENVRRLTEQVRLQHPKARVVVHLEDNERQILALRLNRTLAEIDALGTDELNQLVSDDLSHPHRSQDFLARADGVTVITDSLRSLCPAGVPCFRWWPAADERWFFPRPVPEAFRQVLDRGARETVLFYHGNVHAANVAEVGELYRAVLALNAGGFPVTLIRTGLDTVEFPPALEAKAHVLTLGQIPHHHHLPELMSLADYFVQPGVPDAFNDYRFPSKLPEFFALGRPVILPRTNLGTAVRHGQDAYVLDRADAAGIAGAIRELHANPVLAKTLSDGARDFAQRHFNWSATGESLANFYAKLTEPTPA